jgi:HK97 family phage major capsid protein
MANATKFSTNDLLKSIGDLKTDLKNTKASFEKAMATASKPSTVPQRVLGGFVPQGQDPGWPEKRLEALSKSYPGDDAALRMMSMDRQPKAIGWGKALWTMAALEKRDLINDNVLPASYGKEQFEKEFGFVPMSRATREVHWGGGQVLKTALAEGSGTTGGYLIPPQYQNELLTIAAEDAFIEPRAKVIPMSGRIAWWPMLDITNPNYGTGVSPYFGGVVATWEPEAIAYPETEPGFKMTEWTAWDLVFYAVSSNQLLADNGIGLDALLTSLFGQAITWYKEYAYLQGKGAGSSMPMGVLNAPATIQVTRSAPNSFRFQDAFSMMSRLQMRSWKDACWIAHQSTLPQFGQMVDNQTHNMLVWLNNFQSGNGGPATSKLPTAFLNGMPLFFTEKLPQLGTTGDVMLVDWSRYVIGMRLDLQIDVSPHYLFRNNQLAWRVIARLDGKPWLNSTITDAAGFTVSPYIVLK